MNLELRQRERSELAGIGEWLNELEANSVFLVIDRTAYEGCGARLELQEPFSSLRVVEFANFDTNPKLEQVQAGLAEFRRRPFDVIVAIGGGTAIDIAKLIRFLGASDADPLALIQNPRRITAPNRCPLIAVPTTAGTGSEATHFAVVYIQQKKHSVAHQSILPDFAIVDPTLTESMPAKLTAETGLDALCQSVESIWSVQSTQQSFTYATEALGLVIDHLPTAVHRGTPGARAAMSRASNLAGKAIDISKTTAPHALSYAMTMEFGVAHGHAAALTLGRFLHFNRQCTDDDVLDQRSAKHVHDVIDQIIGRFECENSEQAMRAIEAFVASLGCANRLQELGIKTKTQREQLAQDVNQQRLANNPRAVHPQDIRDILDSIA